MAIATFDPNKPVPQIPSLPKAQSDNYKGLVYDDKNIPLTSLIAYVDGAPWTVEYFRQSLGDHNDLKEIDPGLDPVYQQYDRITMMEIMVQDGLSSSHDPATQVTSVRGNGLIYPFIIPNANDYFITDTNYNKPALFRIVQVDRKTFQRDSVHAIEYVLVDYVDQVQALVDSLRSKVVRTYVFSKDRLVEGLDPILKTEVYDQVSSLSFQYQKLVQYYFHTFFDRRCFTLVLPGQDQLVYDHFLMEYLYKIISSDEAPQIREAKRLQNDNDPGFAQYQFWSLMLERNYDGLNWVNKTMGLVWTRRFEHSGYIRGLFNAVVDYVVYPFPSDTTVDSGMKPVPLLSGTSPVADFIVCPLRETLISLAPTVNRQGGLLSDIDKLYTLATGTVPLYPMVLASTTYVLSNNFYSGTGPLSLLEICVKDYLKGQTLNLNYLTALCNKYPKMERLEQFYYGPILLTLLKEANRSSY